MAQGFKNGGIYRTDLSFPAILANMIEENCCFDLPSFTAQAGIPINLEILVRGVAEEYGDDINLFKSVSAARSVYKTLSRIKSYWEGHKKSLKVEQLTPYHNQAVWGFAISDSMMIDEAYCRKTIRDNKIHYSVFNVLPDHAMYTTARMVLNPTFDKETSNKTMVHNVKDLHENGGIENLIICIGHNNIVGAVTNLDIRLSEQSDIMNYHSSRQCTVFRPEHFELEMRALYERIAPFGIKRVFVPTLPHVTIPPAIRGVNENGTTPKNGYFDYYTRFWIWDDDFNPEKHPHITRDEAIYLDSIVDEYNQIIRKLADEFGYHVVPVSRYVSTAARRRRGTYTVKPFPAGFVEALKQNPKTNYLVDEFGDPRISTDYLKLDRETGKIASGGIFSLDGLHPSTIGYGLIANIYKKHMEEQGVRFERNIDWNFIINSETLVTDPPPLLHNLRQLLRWLAMGNQEKMMFLGKNMLEQMLEIFSTAPRLD
jgi:hypothetical protein